MSEKKLDVVTFKVDRKLKTEIEKLPNRSEFIRSAIMNALQNTCPVCKGAGFLTSENMDQWSEFIINHNEAITDCNDCKSKLVCLHVDKRSNLKCPE